MSSRRPRLCVHRRGRLLVAASLGLLACDPEPDAAEFPDWGEKDDSIGSALTPTRHLSVSLFDGYNRVVDAPVSRRCVEPREGQTQRPPFSVGGVHTSTELHFVNTRQELAEALDIEAQTKVAVGPIGGDASVGFSGEFKASATSVTLLLRSRHTYTVMNQQEHHLTEVAIADLRTDPLLFAQRCGTDYLAGVAYGAEVAILIQIETSDVDEKDKVEAALKTNGIKAGPATIDAELGARFENALKDLSREVTVKNYARGFAPSVDLNALGRLDADAFAVAAQARDQLRDSVERDKCQDAGGCDGEGYLQNNARVAVPMGLLRKRFSDTTNFPVDDAAALDGLLKIDSRAQTALSTLRAHADLYDTMLSIHSDEVGAMLTAERPYEFALYDTRDVVLNIPLDELREHAEKWAKAYHPETGHQVLALRDLVHECWNRALAGDFSACEERPEDTAAGQKILATLEKYGRNRVRPVHYKYAPDLVLGLDAPGVCAAGWRQPKMAEVSRLWYAMEHNEDILAMDGLGLEGHTSSEAWYARNDSDCASGYSPYIRHDGEGFLIGCETNGYLPGLFPPRRARLVGLCVPKDGGVYGPDVFEL